MSLTPSSGPLAGRYAVVSGAARGIGEAIAASLAQRGAEVILADVDAEPARAVADRLTKEGLKAASHVVDIADHASIETLATAVANRWPYVDVLVNNAAVLDGTPLDELTPERYGLVQKVNQDGALWMTLAFRKLLKQSNQPRIVNMASIMGVRGTMDSVAYSTAKGGLINMTRALAVDLAPDGILVNAIAPGFVDTRMALLPDGSGHEHETGWFQDIYIKNRRIPLRRAAHPDEIAAAAMFFCGSDCRYVTGQILLVDGGLSATF